MVQRDVNPPNPRAAGSGQGKPVADADVEFKVTMAGMGAMPAMGGPVRVKPMGDGRHEADFKLAMDGKWRVDVRASDKAGRSFEAQGSLVTGQGGIHLAARGGGASPAMEANAEEPAHPGEVVVEPARRQKIGVRTAPVAQEPFGVTIRAVVHRGLRPGRDP